jgi:two-component system, OmpR family, sensor histidine kinase VicK
MKSANIDINKQEESNINLIATLAHELKTPVTSIKEAISLLSDLNNDTLNIKNRRIIAIAQEEIDRLIRMIDNFLKVASIESGKTHLEKAEVNIEELINLVLDTYSLKIQNKKMHIIKVFSKIPSFVLIDRDRMFEAIANILDNAIKFTPTGRTITVKTKVVSNYIDSLSNRRSTNKNNFLLVTISDTGPGISKNNLERIFKKFERVKSTKHIRGIGLGLTITRNIVELHNGKIWASSVKNHGAKFNILLPVVKNSCR